MSGCSKKCAKYKEREIAYYKSTERERHGSNTSVRRQLTYSSESEPSLPEATPDFRSVRSEATEFQSLPDSESDDEFPIQESSSSRRRNVHEDTDRSIDVVGFTPKSSNSHGRNHRGIDLHEEQTPEPTPDRRGRTHLKYEKTPNLTPHGEMRTGYRESLENQETPNPTPNRFESCGTSYVNARTPNVSGRSGRIPRNQEYTNTSNSRSERSTRFEEETPEVSGRTCLSRFNVSTPSEDSRRNPRFNINTPELTPRSPDVVRDGKIHRSYQIQTPPNNRQQRSPDKYLTYSSDVDLLSLPSTSTPSNRRGPITSKNQNQRTKFNTDSLFSGYVMEKESSGASDSISQNGFSQSLNCQSNCENDSTSIRSLKFNERCLIGPCPKKFLRDKQRERKQVEDARCPECSGLCTLSCFTKRIIRDEFLKGTAATAVFFFLGIKLCWELDSWYIPF